MGFSRQEYWSRLPFPSPGHLPYLGIELRSPALQADALLSELPLNFQLICKCHCQLLVLPYLSSENAWYIFFLLSHFSPVWFIVTPGTVVHQAPLFMGFSRQEYWSGFPCLSPGDPPRPRIKPSSFMSPALAGRFFTTSATWEAQPYLSSKNVWYC